MKLLTGNMKKILNNKIVLFFIILTLGLLVSIYMFPPSYNTDGLCHLHYGYSRYANHYFLEAGRFILIGLWYIFDLIKLDHDVLSVISVFLTNVFLSLSVIKIYSYLKDKTKDTNSLVLILLASTLIIYNPFIQEIFIFEESFCMAIAIYLVVMASIKSIEKKYLISFVILLISSFIYQGILCYYIPLVFTYSFINNKDKKDYIRYISIFLMTLAVSYLVLRLVLLILNYPSSHVGNINIFRNIFLSIWFIYHSFSTMYGLFSPLLFISYIVFIFVYLFILSIKNKDNIKYYSSSVIVSILCLSIPLIPNLIMRKYHFYVFPRMVLPIGSLIGFLLIFVILSKKDKKFNKYLIIIFSIFLVLDLSYIFVNNRYFYNTYKENNTIIYKVEKIINEYEKSTGIIINNIYYSSDNYDMNYVISKGFNENKRKIYEEEDWPLNCAFNIDRNKYKVTLIKDVITKDEKGYFFKDNSLYIDFDKWILYDK